ncbi:MAG: DNRLRE domain-containing protein [Oscillospiraceae bacterium]|nr:DNRLRE domain-containing protein [Oscillospiraceae bacterium]
MKRLLAILLCAVAVLSCSCPAFAADTAVEETGPNDQYRVAEVPELREKNADTYLLSDGTYECVIYAEDKYYKDGNGKYVEIDNSIIPASFKSETITYSYANAASSTKVYFSNNRPGVYIESGKNSLEFSLINSGDVQATTGSKGNAYKFTDFNLQGDNCITYTGAYTSTDLVYSVKKGYVKEYIVLNDVSAPSEFKFEFDTTEYYIEQNDTGTLDVYNLSGELAFEMGSLFALDSAENYTESLKYTIEEVSENNTIVSVSIDPDYLTAPGRAFPVMIDPSIMVTGDSCTYDTYVSSRYPNSNYYLYDWLRTGRDDDYYTRRTYIDFDLPSGISSNDIVNSFIFIKYYSGDSPSIKAYRSTGYWTSSTLTWNNMPEYSTTNASTTAQLYSNNWYGLNVTNIVKSWYAGTYNAYGFLIKDTTEFGTSHWTTFYSSDATSPNKPELHITYTSYGDANLVGVTTSGHDHTTCLTNALIYLSNCDLDTVYTHFGSFSVSEIQNYLDDDDNVLFMSRSHGGPLISQYDYIQYGTYIDLNSSGSVDFRSNTNMGSLDLSNMTLVMFIGCKTGAGGTGGANLPSVAVAKGAACAVGFRDSIYCDYANDWTEEFCEYMEMGLTVNSACLTLNNDYGNTGLDTYVVCGNGNTKINY